MWYPLKDKQSIKHLLTKYDGFHDSCLKEMMIHTNSYVDEDYHMQVEPTMTAYFYFQSQLDLPYPVIEMKFEDVVECHLIPNSKYFDAIVLDVTLAIYNGAVYWANSPDFTPEKPIYQKGLYWISAKQAFWRPMEKGFGSDNRYIFS